MIVEWIGAVVERRARDLRTVSSSLTLFQFANGLGQAAYHKCTPSLVACPGFLKAGGPISLGSLKKGHQILKGGGGSSTLVSLGRQI